MYGLVAKFVCRSEQDFKNDIMQLVEDLIERLMAEELEVLWGKLSFTEEGEGVELGSSSTKAAREVGKNCVIMKIMTPRSISLDTLRKNLRMLLS